MMKKVFVSCILFFSVMCLFLTAYCKDIQTFSATTNAHLTNDEITDLSNLQSSTKTTIFEERNNIVFYVKSDEDLFGKVLVIVAYSKNGKIINLMNIPQEHNTDFTYVVMARPEKLAKIKVFLWNSTVSLEPDGPCEEFDFDDGNVTSKIDESQSVFVVTALSCDVTSDDEDVIYFYGIQDGITRSFALFDDINGYTWKIADGRLNLAKGTVMLVGPEEDGYVNEIEILVEVCRTGNDISITNIPSEGIFNGKRYKSDMGKLNICSNGAYINDGTIRVGGYDKELEGNEGYKVYGNINIVCADFTAARYSATTVKKRGIEFVDVDPGKYDIHAFFRVYDVDNPNFTNLSGEKNHIKDIVFYMVNPGDGIVSNSKNNEYESDELDEGYIEL